MKKVLSLFIFLCSTSAYSANLTITVTNATQALYFTPLLFVAHDETFHLFQAGQTASSQLEQLAEEGNIDPLNSFANNAGFSTVGNPAQGPLAPGSQTEFHFDTHQFQHLSFSAMILPTNDGFVGVDSWPIPTEPGIYTFISHAYDAGTEANDELKSSIPNPPFLTFGHNGSGVETQITQNKIHIHPGNVGDHDPNGGHSDLVITQSRWLNPIAMITVHVH